MGRPRDEDCWKEVIVGDDGELTCKRCGKRFKGGVARIKAHLGKEKGKGITLCNPGNVPVNEGVNNNIMAGSSNPPKVVNEMNSLEVARHADYAIHGNITNSSNHQNVTDPIYPFEVTGGAQEMIYAYIDHQYDTGPIISQGLQNIDDVVGSGNSDFESEISKIQELIDMLTREKGNTEKELQWLECRTGKKRKRDSQIDGWLARTTDLEGRALEMIRSLGQGWSTGRSALEVEIKELIEDVQIHTEGKPLVLSNELVVGGSFDIYVEKLWKLLRDDKVLIIGILGMGGMGKTTLVAHFKNKIKTYRDFKNVFSVTVSQDFGIFKLQSDVAKMIGIKLDEDDKIIERAKILSSALQKKGKLLLILDDIWNHIDLQKVGIPLRVNGIKLILTSRSKYVLQQMDCPFDNIIIMGPLSSKEAWELFLLKLGCYGTLATLPHELEEIARSIVNRCDGLPLAISVMARTMKGVNDIRQWRRVLEKFENLATGKEMEDVFKVLKLSYDHLMDESIQNCFLRCALYSKFSANNLIMNLVEEGLIKEKKSLEEMFDEGHAILGKLKGHSLLLDCSLLLYRDTDRNFRVNGMVREMACRIMKGRYMVKRSKRLTKILDMQEWVPYLHKISLMGNDIEEIPADTSPNCPQLSTLIFSHNKFSQMPDCFFNCMNALTMLDLSYNEELTSLPNSLSSLRSLKSLLLKGCSSLKYVPPLEELQELSRLVISDTSIEEVPSGLAMLAKLKWLDLSWNRRWRFIPGFVLSGLTNVQYLDLRGSGTYKAVENVGGMSKLEYFAGDLEVGKNLADYVENILDRGRGPEYYSLCMGFDCHEGEKVEFYGNDKEARHFMEFGDCEAFDHLLLPRDLDRLWIANNKQWSGGICDALSFKAPSSLRRTDVGNCPKLERLLCLSGSCSLCKHLQNLQSLSLYALERLEDVIWKENDEGICLPNLRHLEIKKCDRMEKLLTPLSLQELPNLERIIVSHCDSMKEIFAVRSSEDDNIDSTITLYLPKLSHLEISYCHKMEKLLTPLSLQQLPNLETIQVRHCDSMKEIFEVRSSEDDYIDSTITLPNSFKKLTLAFLPQLKFVCKKIIVSESPPTLAVPCCYSLIKGSLRHRSSHSDSEPIILW